MLNDADMQQLMRSSMREIQSAAQLATCAAELDAASWLAT
jgi:hypothetical protein